MDEKLVEDLYKEVTKYINMGACKSGVAVEVNTNKKKGVTHRATKKLRTVARKSSECGVGKHHFDIGWDIA